MKNPKVTFLMLMALFALALSSATATSGPATNPADPGQIQWWAKVPNIVCTPQPERTGDGFKLACYIPVGDSQGATGTPRNNSDILRDLYKERNEKPFWRD